MRILPHDVWSKDPAWYPDHVKLVRSTTSSVNSFGMIDTSGNLQHDKHDNFCTAPMNRYNRAQVSWLVWSLYSSTDPKSFTWHKNLLNPDASPWRRALRKDNAILEGVSGSNHVAMIKIDDKTMLKDIVNLCIALRQGSEVIYNVHAFINKLPSYIDMGFTFNEALACHVLECGKNKYYDKAMKFIGGHGFLSSGYVFNLKGFASGNPALKGPTFRSRGYYNPSDEIWRIEDKDNFIKFLKSGVAEPEPDKVGMAMRSVFQKSRDADIAMPVYGTYDTYNRTPKEMLEYMRS